MDSPGEADVRGEGREGVRGPRPRRTTVGATVVASLGTGLIAALLLPFAPVDAVDENFAAGMVLIGFGVGWGLLAGLSARLTDQPQLWAVGPAVFMGASGLIALLAPDSFVDALGWVWPPALMALVAWVYLRARRDLLSRTRRWVLNPVLAVLLLASVGGIYETLGKSTEPEIAMRGELVDIGPYRLHLECSGSGAPTVILEPGGGASAATLGLLAPSVARYTRVCVYDRAGRGWSDAAPSPTDGLRIATDLRTLLDRGGVQGPYVLAGHSFGGLYSMAFAAKYPDLVAGLVLIDSTAPRAAPLPAQPSESYSLVRHVSALVSTLSRVGVGRLIAQTSFSPLPTPYRDEARASAATAKEMASFIEEFAVASRSQHAAGELTDLDGKPLVVLTADLGNAPGWTADQNDMAELSTNSQHHVVSGATHQSLLENPDHVAAVSNAINDVVVSVRTSTPLLD